MKNYNQIKVTVEKNGETISFFTGLGSDLEVTQLENNLKELFKSL